MAFTFDLTASGMAGNLAFVRSEIGDVNSDSPMFQDEEIQFYLRRGSPQLAVISLLEGLIAKIANTPNFKADWLQVDSANQLKALTELLKIKRRSYGLVEAGEVGTVAFIQQQRIDVRE